MEKSLKKPTIRETNLLYLIPMALFFVVDEISLKTKAVNISYEVRLLFTIVMEILLVFLPMTLFFYFRKWDIKGTLRLNKISLDNFVLSAVIMLFAIPVTAFLNFLVVIVLKYIDKVHAQPIFPSESILQLMLTLLAIAVTPAIFEELLCRGVIMKGYERIGSKCAILVSAILFALLHRDIQSLVGTFLLGALIAYIVYRTNSIFAGMIAHFVNNGFIVVMTYAMMKIPKMLGGYYPEIENEIKNQSANSIASIPTEQLITSAIFLGIIAVVFGAVLTGLIFLLKYNTKDINREVSITEYQKVGNMDVILLIASLTLVFYRFISQLGILEYIRKIT